MTDENKEIKTMNIADNKEKNRGKCRFSSAIKEYFIDSIFIYSFFASILYAILFYISATPNILAKIYKYSYVIAEYLSNLTFYYDFIAVFFIWIIYLIINKPTKKLINLIRNKYCIGYGLFMFPLTVAAFFIMVSNNNTQNLWSLSITFSLYRIVGSILFLIVINFFIEVIILIYKKLFNFK